MKTTFNLLSSFALFFLLLCLSGSSFASLSSPEKLDTDVSLSIQLNRKTIKASALEEQILPMLISSKINKIDFSSFPRNPIDLVCVFGIKHNFYSQSPSLHTQIEEIRNLLKDLQPLMTDQDRIAVVVFYNSCGIDRLFPAIDLPNLSYLVNTSAQNWETIIQSIGEKVIREDISLESSFKAAMKILNGRNETNRTTGVFISSDSFLGDSFDDYDCWYTAAEDRTMEEIDWAKRSAGIQDKKWVIQTFQGERKDHTFAESFAALQAGIVESKLLIKLEKSGLLQDVRISSPYFDPQCKGWEEEDSDLYPWWKKWEVANWVMKRNPSVKSGEQEEYAFDLVIPKIAAKDLPSSPMEVKIASCQLVFLFGDGSEVAVKNEDLMVKIVKEGEEIIGEEESREAVRDFYHKWGTDWLIRTAWREIVEDYSYDRARQILKRYQESLDDSIVKDDEMLQKIWKDAEAEIIYDEEEGVEHDIY